MVERIGFAKDPPPRQARSQRPPPKRSGCKRDSMTLCAFRSTPGSPGNSTRMHDDPAHQHQDHVQSVGHYGSIFSLVADQDSTRPPKEMKSNSGKILRQLHSVVAASPRQGNALLAFDSARVPLVGAIVAPAAVFTLAGIAEIPDLLNKIQAAYGLVMIGSLVKIAASWFVGIRRMDPPA